MIISIILKNINILIYFNIKYFKNKLFTELHGSLLDAFVAANTCHAAKTHFAFNSGAAPRFKVYRDPVGRNSTHKKLAILLGENSFTASIHTSSCTF